MLFVISVWLMETNERCMLGSMATATATVNCCGTNRMIYAA